MLSSPGPQSGSSVPLMAPPPPGASVAPVGQTLWSSLEAAESVAQAAPTWLTLLCEQTPLSVGGVLVHGEPDVGPFVPVANWPAGQGPSELLAEVANDAFEARAPAVLQAQGHSALALPWLMDGKVLGLVALELTTSTPPSAVLDAMRWALGRLDALVLQESSQVRQTALERMTTALNLLAATLAESSFSAAAHALATDLALTLHCDRVSVGFVSKGSSDVVAMSHSAQFGERMNLVRAIAQAMDEALDQRCAIVFPVEGKEVLVVRDHAALARQHGCGAILSLPFVIDGAEVEGLPAVRGAFMFERAGQQPFTADDVALCQGAVALASRVLQAKRQAERPWWTRVRDKLQHEYAQLLGPRHLGRKLTALSLLSATLFFSVATGSYEVHGNATLEGAVRRVVVAPYDGYIEAAPRRAGDQVKAGEVLAAMDPRDLSLEQLRVAGQVQQYARQAQGALAEHERAQGGISQAQAQQAQAQLDLLADQIQRAAIVAPFDGLVVSGDLSQQLGNAVKRGQVLFEVSPLNAYRVTLEVDESEIDAVRMGQKGRLLLVALPGQAWPVTVTRITPVTVSHEGRSFFRIEASLDQAGAALRPGMEGVAKIDTGSRHLIWIWTHRFVDWLRVWAWTWL